jgi:hypothetical protein
LEEAIRKAVSKAQVDGTDVEREYRATKAEQIGPVEFT